MPSEEYTATLNKTVLTLGAKAGEGDRLFGSITGADIADAIKDARGRVLALNNEDYPDNFNPVFVLADPVDNPP